MQLASLAFGKKRTIFYFLGPFSNLDHVLFCGDSLTVAQRKFLAHNVYQKKSNPSTSK
jgi:hypothetical protein